MERRIKLYTRDEASDLIKVSVKELYDIVKSAKINGIKDVYTAISQWSSEMLLFVEQLIALEVTRRHPQGVAFYVWSGPPGSGKGTNIKALDILGEAYAEIVSQGFEARFQEPLHGQLLSYSLDKSTVNTGTDGIFNKPKGEYEELFGLVDDITGDFVAEGWIPDGSIASPLIELMIFLRLVQGSHRIQIDLWPRLEDQLDHYVSLVKEIKNKGGNVEEDFVNIRLLDRDDMEKIRANPSPFAKKSKDIGKYIREVVMSNMYSELLAECSKIADKSSRYYKESERLDYFISQIESKYDDDLSEVIIRELKQIIERMNYRFKMQLNNNEIIRADAYPLSLLKRLSVYTEKTSYASLIAESEGIDVRYVSTKYAPEEVVSDLFGELFGVVDDPRWNKVITLAGDIAKSIVDKESLIVDQVVDRLRGILVSE